MFLRLTSTLSTGKNLHSVRDYIRFSRHEPENTKNSIQRTSLINFFFFILCLRCSPFSMCLGNKNRQLFVLCHRIKRRALSPQRSGIYTRRFNEFLGFIGLSYAISDNILCDSERFFHSCASTEMENLL